MDIISRIGATLHAALPTPDNRDWGDAEDKRAHSFVPPDNDKFRHMTVDDIALLQEEGVPVKHIHKYSRFDLETGKLIEWEEEVYK